MKNELDKFGIWLIGNRWINTTLNTEGIFYYQQYKLPIDRQLKPMKELVEIYLNENAKDKTN